MHCTMAISPAAQAALLVLWRDASVLVPDDLTRVRVLRRRADVQRRDLFFASRVWAGEPRIEAPDRCDELRWADIDRLPDNTVRHLRAGLEAMQRGRLFSTFGWTPTS